MLEMASEKEILYTSSSPALVGGFTKSCRQKTGRLLAFHDCAFFTLEWKKKKEKKFLADIFKDFKER